ncbi:hypothetical protein IWQ61_005897 [Dispira simplex]|nr:hypothetical protein IWQ61_005897 [Dispira simplex]
MRAYPFQIDSLNTFRLNPRHLANNGSDPFLSTTSTANIETPSIPKRQTTVPSNAGSTTLTSSAATRSLKRAGSVSYASTPGWRVKSARRLSANLVLGDTPSTLTSAATTPSVVTFPPLVTALHPNEQVFANSFARHYRHPDQPNLATVDALGNIKIWQPTQWANRYQVLFETQLKQPVVTLHWLNAQRQYDISENEQHATQLVGYTLTNSNPWQPMVRRPLVGPRNPFGMLAFLVVTSGGGVHFYYQYGGSLFTSTSASLYCTGLHDQAQSHVQVAQLALDHAGNYILVTSTGMGDTCTDVRVYEINVDFNQEPAPRISMVSRSQVIIPPLSLPESDQVSTHLVAKFHTSITQVLILPASIVPHGTTRFILVLRRSPGVSPNHSVGASWVQLWEIKAQTTSPTTELKNDSMTDKVTTASGVLHHERSSRLAEYVGTNGDIILSLSLIRCARPHFSVFYQSGVVKIVDCATLVEDMESPMAITIPTLGVPLTEVRLSENKRLVMAMTANQTRLACPLVDWGRLTTKGLQSILLGTANALARVILNRLDSLDIVAGLGTIPQRLNDRIALLEGVVTAAYCRTFATINTKDLQPWHADARTLRFGLMTLLPSYCRLPGFRTQYTLALTVLHAMAAWDNLSSYSPTANPALLQPNDNWLTVNFMRDLGPNVQLLRWVIDVTLALVRDGYLLLNTFYVDVTKGIVAEKPSRPGAETVPTAPSRCLLLLYPFFRRQLYQLLQLSAHLLNQGETLLARHSLTDKRMVLADFTRFVRTRMPLKLESLLHLFNQLEQSLTSPSEPSGIVRLANHPCFHAHILATGRLDFTQGIIAKSLMHELDSKDLAAVASRLRTQMSAMLALEKVSNQLVFYPTGWLDLGSPSGEESITRVDTSKDTHSTPVELVVSEHHLGPSLDPLVQVVMGVGAKDEHSDSKVAGVNHTTNNSLAPLSPTPPADVVDQLSTIQNLPFELHQGSCRYLDVILKVPVVKITVPGVRRCTQCYRYTAAFVSNSPNTATAEIGGVMLTTPADTTNETSTAIEPKWLSRYQRCCPCGGKWIEI